MCGAVSFRHQSDLNCSKSMSLHRASGWTTSRQNIWAIPNNSGASATRTAQCVRTNSLKRSADGFASRCRKAYLEFPMLKGVHLTLLIGPAVPNRAPKLVMDALQSVQVTSSKD